MKNITIIHTISYLLLTILMSFILLFSPAGPTIITYIAELFDINLVNVETFIWNAQIHIESATYSNKQYSLQANNTHISLGFFHVNKIQIQQLDATFSSIPSISSSGSSFGIPQSIEIDQINIHTSSLLKHIEVKHWHTFLGPSLSRTSFEHNGNMYGVSTTQKPYKGNLVYNIKLSHDKTFFEFTALDTQEKLMIRSTTQSNLKNTSFTYYKKTGAWDTQIDHRDPENTVNVSSSYQPDANTFKLNIPELISNTPFWDLNAQGEINTEQKVYNITGSINGIEFQTSGENTVQSQLNISNLSSISPYLNGGLTINTTYFDGQWSLNATSNNLLLPGLRIDQLSIQYFPFNNTLATISAKYIRNSFLSIEDPNIQISTINDMVQINLSGISNNLSQKATLNIETDESDLTLSISDFDVRTEQNTWTLTQKQPIVISSENIQTGPIKIQSSDQSFATIDLEYLFESNHWTVEHNIHNLYIALQSNEVLGSETDLTLHSSILNGQGIISGSPNQKINIDAEYELSNIHASVINIIPNFVFPLDYHMTRSTLTWNPQGLNGVLHSNQGDITLTTRNDVLFAQSKALQFEHGLNSTNFSLDLSIDQNLTAGQINLFSLTNNPDKTDYFLSLPNDIEIIGDIPITSPQTSSTDINIEIHASETLLQLYGFEGSLNGDLNIIIPKNKPLLYTGSLELNNPTLTLLNRSMKFNHVRLTYNNDDFYDGQIDLHLTQSGLFHSQAGSRNIQIDLSIGGTLDNPTFDIISSPIQLTQIESLSYIFSKSTQLPSGNENYTLLEIISGLKRKEGVIFVLETLNNFANLINVDIAIRPGYDASQGFSENLRQTELIFTKQLTESLSLIFRHQFNKETDTAALNLKLTPNVSAETQYGDGDFALNLFYHN